MDTGMLLGIIALVVALGSGAFLLLYFVFPKQQTNMRSLMGAGASGLMQQQGGAARARARSGGATEEDFEVIKSAAKKKAKSKAPITLQERFFHAGMFSEKERKDFQRLRLLAPLIAAPAIALVASYISAPMALIGAVFGLLIGFQLPFSILERRIKARAEDILFFLPLVVEQIVIGVSSSLDIGPCIQRVVSMADERDSHNPVTELLRHAQLYIKSGVSMGDSLMEIGRLSGHTELKHTFMSLAQVAKHGGEITRQLQELADAVASQRETKIESKIKKLELEATGPVGLVFVGFMVILMTGFASQLMQAFG